MGGHVGGRDASEAAVKTIFADVETAHAVHPGAALKAAIEHAGQVVFDLGGKGANMLRPGSTAVALLVHEGGTEVAHVGDSRAYVVRAGQIYPLTRDHSMVQQMVDAGVLSEHDAVGHPDSNKITRALGMTPTVDVELRPTSLAHAKGDIYLLASDGLCDLVMPAEILNVVSQAHKARGLEFAAEQLVALANARGGHDNITVLLAEIVDAPDCTATQTKTLVADPAAMAGSTPATVPVLPAVGPMPPAGPELSGTGVHPTVVDDPVDLFASPAPAPGASDGASAAPAPTWVGDDADIDSPDDQASNRGSLWIAMGAALVVFGLLVVALSIWWAWSGASQREPGSPNVAQTRIALSCSLVNSLRTPFRRPPTANG
jgi:serine/threonine protein phosphatase PrpC